MGGSIPQVWALGLVQIRRGCVESKHMHPLLSALGCGYDGITVAAAVAP